MTFDSFRRRVVRRVVGAHCGVLFAMMSAPESEYLFTRPHWGGDGCFGVDPAGAIRTFRSAVGMGFSLARICRSRVRGRGCGGSGRELLGLLIGLLACLRQGRGTR